MDAGDAPHEVARTHARHGTAAFLATTMTAPLEEIEGALAAVAGAMGRQEEDEAEILGVHLEGPFISPNQLGAQPPFALPATIELLQRLCSIGPIKVVTMAPEADASGVVAGWLRSKGVRVQIGHTAVDLNTAADWIRNRADGVTHMFNAMGGFHHRSSCCPGAALAYATHAELITDLIHTDKGAALAALRAIPRLYAVTDGTAAAGMPDGQYRLGQNIVFRQGDAVRLESGGLAGSCLTMDVAFRNLISIGLPLEEATLRTSTIAATYLGLERYGRVAVGEPASFVCVDEQGMAKTVVTRGRMLSRC
jgi:N-acetylglucosamine-6-phosphate deacetylase